MFTATAEYPEGLTTNQYQRMSWP